MVELTDQQIAAVDHDGLIVVSACPGSGKTTVVAHRMQRLIKDKHLLPYQGVAVLSFTNVAKDAVTELYSSLACEAIRYPHFVGTIDSFMNHFLLRVIGHRLLGKKRESSIILDVNSTWINARFPKLARFKLNGQNITLDCDGNVIYQQRSMTISPEAQEYISSVKEQLWRSNIVTQGDVSFYCLQILRQYPSFAESLIRRFPYLMIDEAQDCSDTQMAIVDELKLRGHLEIMLLGDPYQAIYEWRDANPKLLLDKEGDSDWVSLPITETQRCGSSICGFLNRFHSGRTISQDVSRTLVSDAEVVVRHNSDFTIALAEFLSHARSKGIAMNQASVAVLYGGHRSVANIRKTKINEDDLFAVRDSDVQSLPLRAKIQLDRSQFRQAYECMFKYYFFVTEKERIRSSRLLKDHPLASTLNKIRLWNTCKELPSLHQSLESWITAANRVLKDTADVLGVEFLALKRKRTQPNILDLQDDLISDAGGSAIGEITVQNIHQIKGRTFDAVMIYVDSGRGQWKLTVKKIKEGLTQHDLFGSAHLDDTRCFYVAASRARRLLWVSSGDREIEDILM
jgi:superfamily I DNA/RNA helicase